MLYKIVFKLGIYIMVVSFFFHVTACLSQTKTVSKYGVQLINKSSDYQLTVRNDSAKKMVELLKLMPGLVYDLRYATTNNFTHLQLYVPAPRQTFLRLPAARALAAVQNE